jgi:hypothetical protein
MMLALAGVVRGGDVNGVALAHVHRGGVGYGSDACATQLKAIAGLGANWVALNDFGYMPSVSQPQLTFRGDRTLGRAAVLKTIADAHAAGLKVLIKPHLWSREFGNASKWPGDVKMTSEADWAAWFAAYGDYVVDQATIAAEGNADGLCVGVELEGTSGREADWRALIARVRAVYKGPLTYCAAFLEWKQIAWWDAVDVIGISAYFPVAKDSPPAEADVRLGWAKVYDELGPVARRFGKRVCFLELGYTPSTTAAAEPWSYKLIGHDPAAQAMLYRVAIDEADQRDFMAGVFVWKWFTADQQGRRGDPFGLQDKDQTLAALKAAWTK